MNKKQYIQPLVRRKTMAAQQPIASSNEVEGGGINTNPSTMEEGDGDDAVKNRYDDWGNLW